MFGAEKGTPMNYGYRVAAPSRQLSSRYLCTLGFARPSRRKTPARNAEVKDGEGTLSTLLCVPNFASHLMLEHVS